MLDLSWTLQLKLLSTNLFAWVFLSSFIHHLRSKHRSSTFVIGFAIFFWFADYLFPCSYLVTRIDNCTFIWNVWNIRVVLVLHTVFLLLLVFTKDGNPIRKAESCSVHFFLNQNIFAAPKLSNPVRSH